MIKLSVIKCIAALNSLSLLKERQNQQTGEIIKGVTIPSEKAKTGYWLGRIEDKLTSISKQYQSQNDGLIKKLGEPVKVRKVDPNDSKKTIEVNSGNFHVPFDSEKYEEYKLAIESIQNSVEEIDINPMEFEMFEGIDFPAGFWAGMTSFMVEPKTQSKDKPKEEKLP